MLDLRKASEVFYGFQRCFLALLAQSVRGSEVNCRYWSRETTETPQSWTNSRLGCISGIKGPNNTTQRV